MAPKFKKFNAANSRTSPVGVPYVHLNGKNGVIAFSRKASEMIGLTDKCGISVFQDEDSPRDWFVALDSDAQAFKVRKTVSGFCFNNSGIARRILDCIGVPPSAATNPPGRDTSKMAASVQIVVNPTQIDGVNYFLLLTAKPLTQR